LRRCERLKARGLHKAQANELAKSAIVENELGLTALSGVRPLIERLSNEETDQKAVSLWRKSLSQLREEWRQQVADLDVDAAKAREVIRMVDEVCEAANREGPAGLGRYLSDRLNELQKVRRSKKRGTQAESFPYWKIVVAAVAVVTFLISLAARSHQKLASFVPEVHDRFLSPVSHFSRPFRGSLG
jgi:anti-sigma-K factor RskA